MENSDYALIVITPLLMVSSVLLAFLLFIFRNKQPLKSHQGFSIFGCLVFLLAMVKIITTNLTFLNPRISGSLTNDFSCFYFLYQSAPILICFVIIQFLVIARYLSIKMLKKNEDSFNKLQQESITDFVSSNPDISRHSSIQQLESDFRPLFTKLERQIKVAKVFLSWWFAALICIAFAVLWFVLEIITAGILQSQGICTMSNVNASIVMNSVDVALFLLILFSSILLYTIDMILFIKGNGCSFLDYWVYDDPFYFRIEFVFLIGSISVGFAASIVSQFVKSPSTSQSTLIVLQSVLGFVVIIAMIFVLFGMAGFVLIVTIFQTIKFKYGKQGVGSVSATIVAMLRDSRMRIAFYQYCRKEMSQENLFLYDQIINYKEMVHKGSLNQALSKAKSILHTYIDTEAPIAVNISGSDRTSFLVKYKILVDSSEEQRDTETMVHLFDSIELSVLANLRDTFLRFRVTSQARDMKVLQL